MVARRTNSRRLGWVRPGGGAVLLAMACVCGVRAAADDAPGDDAPADDAPALYEGRTVSQWAEAMRSDDDRVNDGSVAAMVSFGTAAVPYLREILRDEQHPKPRGRAIVATGRIGVGAKEALPELIACLQAKEYFVRGWSSNAIGAMGTEAGAAAPALIESLRDWDHDSRGHALSALSKIGPAAIPGLMKLAEAREPETRREALRALGPIQPRDEKVVTLLKRTVHDPTMLVAVEAAFAHWRMTQETALANEVLSDALERGDRLDRFHASSNLMQMGRDARGSLEQLQDVAANDSDSAVRSFASKAIEIINREE